MLVARGEARRGEEGERGTAVASSSMKVGEAGRVSSGVVEKSGVVGSRTGVGRDSARRGAGEMLLEER